MTQIEHFLKDQRKALIDLSGRNRFLNFKETKRRSLRIFHENPVEIYQSLVINERPFYLMPHSEDEADHQDPDGSETGLFRLNTAHTREELARRLTYCTRDARSILDEQGYNALHLALCFLVWYASPDSHDPLLAPLLLVPVRIRRVFGSHYEGTWTNEEIQVNEPLKNKLREQNIVLPPFGGENDIESVKKYLKTIQTQVEGQGNWSVENVVYLDFFNFTKMVMWRDLDPQSWPKDRSPLKHRVLQKLSASSPTHTPGARFPENEVDTRLNLRETYFVMDADPSQIAVIEDVKAGHDLVVEGPPGTGKSQTIVNLIGEMLSRGKKVLFVSEKLAALEVVKKRLDEADLGDFCLELHSRKASRKGFLEEMKKALECQQPPPPNDALLHRLEMKRDRLNAYAKAISEPYGALGKSPFELMCMREEGRSHFDSRTKPKPSLEFKDALSWSKDAFDAALEALDRMKQVLGSVAPVPKHPFYACDPQMLEGPDLLIAECMAAGEALRSSVQEWVDRGLWAARSLDDIPKLIDASRLICESVRFRPLDHDVLSRHDISLSRSEALSLVDNAERLQATRTQLETTFNRNAFKLDKSALPGKIRLLPSNCHMLFHPFRHRKLRNEVYELYKDAPAKSLHVIVQDLCALCEYGEAQQELDETGCRGEYFFRIHWKGEKSDCGKLKALWDWLESFQGLRQEGIVSDAAIGEICSKLDAAALKESSQKLADAWQLFSDKYYRLVGLLRPNHEKIFGNVDHQPSLSEILDRVALWDSGSSKWHQWRVYLSDARRLSQTVAAPLAPLVESGALGPDDIFPAFHGNMAEAILKTAVRERSELKDFMGAAHESCIKDFADLDLNLTSLNKKRLFNKLCEMRRKAIHDGGLALIKLKAVIAAAGNHSSIRRLFAENGAFLQELKPCLMMSPLSVAQFLEPGKVHFDLIVFDEASQVRPSDALGAILRGDQLVVIGDSQQLPPTSFFEHVVDAADEEPDESLVDEEDLIPLAGIQSLLGLCGVTFNGTPGRLKWHYRSEHESLIAVSNDQFYDNSLKVYPSPEPRNDTLGLHYVCVPDGKYDRGRSRTNPGEALAVVRAVQAHYDHNPELSLGIGTFNEAQRDRIWDELEKWGNEQPAFRKFLNPDKREALFVKNLEMIQGDERDVIFISIGYGFDPDDRLTLNFGPLNQQGGERRLNVLISRARRKCVVFSNFKASHLNIPDTANRGVMALKVFLEYAETERMTGLKPRDFESEFEKAVHDFLAVHGITTVPQVGTAGYRIDLGVPHPSQPGRYVLGIECDGAKYHSSSVARERDRLRSQVLVKLGWKLHRVWSTDWYHSRPVAEQRLLNAVQSAIEKAARQSDEIKEAQPRATETGPPNSFESGSAPTVKTISQPQSDTEASEIPFERDIRDPLLRMVYDNNEELRAGESLAALTEYLSFAPSTSDPSERVWPRGLEERVQWALDDLTRNSFLRKTDPRIWEITDEGKAKLRDMGLA